MKEIDEFIKLIDSLDKDYIDHDALQFTFSNAKKILKYGEANLALEDTLTNFYEFDVVLSEDQVRVVVNLATALNMPMNKWADLFGWE